MGLLTELLSYIDSRKRVAGSNLADAYNNPREFAQGLFAPPPEIVAERGRTARETFRRLQTGGGLLGMSVMPGVDKITDTPEFSAMLGVAPAPKVFPKWDVFGWEVYNEAGNMIRGSTWKPGMAPKKFDDPAKAVAWGEKEMRKLEKLGRGEQGY